LNMVGLDRKAGLDPPYFTSLSRGGGIRSGHG
jgi:hypothetical protein